MEKAGTTHITFPAFGWLGLSLVGVFWYLNWGLEGLRTHWAFFPLWLGYVLVVEAMVVKRRGNSILRDHPWAFAGLFLLSIPSWWLFEGLNRQALYWYYAPVDAFSDLEYFLYCSLNFSVVLPAVFSTTALFSTFSWVRKMGAGPKVGRKAATRWLFFILGWLMLAALLIWPEYGLAFLWMSLYFILDPVNYWLGQPSLLQQTARGDWRLVIALWAGCLFCGIFWELWNYYASPKWFYDIPFVDFWHVFEMPLIGYLGYLPFALELFALYALVMGGQKVGRKVLGMLEQLPVLSRSGG